MAQDVDVAAGPCGLDSLVILRPELRPNSVHDKQIDAINNDCKVERRRAPEGTEHAKRPGGRPSDREQKAPEWSRIEAAKRPTWATKRPGAGIADVPKWQSAGAAEQSSECSETGFETREQTVSPNNLSWRPSPHARNQKTTACNQSIDRSVNQLIIQSAQTGEKGMTD